MTFYTYRVAGQDLRTDFPWSNLDAFRWAEAGAGALQFRVGPLSEPFGAGRCIYRGTAWVGRQWCTVACWAGPAGYDVHMESLGRFRVTRGPDILARLSPEPGLSDSLIGELCAGPMLVLALALCGIWCLHASAILVDGRGVAFLGPSGAGKSTLAAYFSRQPDSSWRLLSDDLLAFHLRDGQPWVYPAFPQLKLPTGRVPLPDHPEQLPLVAAYQVESEGVAETTLTPVDKQAAMLALIRHSVGARLFAPDLLARHLDICSVAAAALATRRLTYPHLPAAPAQVRALIQADLTAFGKHSSNA